MKLSKQLPTALLLVFAGALSAAEEYQDSIPIDLARALLGGGPFDPGREVRLFQDIPDDFPDFTLPDETRVLGTVQRGNQQQVVLETPREPEDALRAVRQAFGAAGWELLPSPYGESPQRGFISSAPSAYPSQICHDEHGIIMVAAAQDEADSLVTLTLNALAGIGGRDAVATCEQYRNRFRPGMDPQGIQQGGIREFMPRLVLPESRLPQRSFMRGISGSPNDLSTQAHVQNDWEIERLLRHFDEQLEQQDWTRENGWSGPYTAGGSWTRSPESDLRLVGILQVVDTGEDTFEVTFRMMAPEHEGANAAGAGRAFLSPGP